MPITVCAGVASAQTTGGAGLTIGLNPSATITHALPDGTSFTRAATLNPAGVNFEDCERDIVLTFPLVATGSARAASGYLLYGFAGTGCDHPGNTCWPVVDGPISYNLEGSGFSVAIRARQILAQYALPVKQAYATVATTDDSSCHIQPTDAALQLSVYFVFATSMDLAQVGGSGEAPLGVDLAAAAPPTLLSVNAGNDGLSAKWTPLTDLDVTGYDVFYAPPGSGDGGACGAPFPPGETVDSDYPFAAVSGSTSATASFAGLTNGEAYAVGVAATDAYGNVGAVSTPICQSPSASAPPVDTATNDGGGDAGGGGCALGGHGGSTGAVGSALLAGLAIVSAARRRRLTGRAGARALRGTRSRGGARCRRPARSPSPGPRRGPRSTDPSTP